MTTLDVAAGVFLGLIAFVLFYVVGWLFVFLGLPAFFSAVHAVEDWNWRRKAPHRNRKNWSRTP